MTFEDAADAMFTLIGTVAYLMFIAVVLLLLAMIYLCFCIFSSPTTLLRLFSRRSRRPI